jgi:hypothetical protein
MNLIEMQGAWNDWTATLYDSVAARWCGDYLL